MKTIPCFTLTLITFITFAFVQNSSAQDNSPEYVVRLIYFLPNDRQPYPNIDTDFDKRIKEVQQYYADMMEYHGFERKTFRLETDENGMAIVHHVKGKEDTKYYKEREATAPEWPDITRELGISRGDVYENVPGNVYLIARDIQNRDLSHDLLLFGGAASGNSTGGVAYVSARAIYLGNHELIIHELGHTFGLRHDNDITRTDVVYFPGTDSIISERMYSSFCAAEWLDKNRYFNNNPHIFNENTSVEMLTPSLDAPPDVIRFPFEITDPDGLHQVQFVSTSTSFIGCKKLNGKNTTVELVTTKLIDSKVILLQVMDVHGNWEQYRFPIDITSLPLPSPEVISIPDPSLAAAVRETLGLAPEADITQLDMVRLRRFTATNRQIIDLTGLEHAIRINWLSLSKNQISNITAISELTELIHLYINSNSINGITPLKGLVNLENLNLGDNQISDISPLAGLTNLKELELDGNSISDIRSLTGLTNLEDLALTNNQISDIHSLTGLTNLKKIYLGYNRISDINPLTRLVNLEKLYLGRNQIKACNSLTRLTKLKVLFLDNNQISNIRSLAGLTNLEALFFGGNQIRDITPLSGLIHLRDLQLAENQISDIKPLEELTNLEALFFGGNQIRDITPLSGLTHLRDLSLAKNHISNIKPLEELTNLVNLSLQENRISDVNSLVGLANLAELKLWRNPIKDRKPLLALLRKNPDIKIYLKNNREPLPVTLSHFRAEHTDAGVVLKWTTESEVDNAGFYIYRSETKDGEFKVVNPSMIQGAGTTGERNEYTWTDTTAKPNTVYYYRIEDVSHAGVREQLATVRLRGLVSASGKLTTAWADLKKHR